MGTVWVARQLTLEREVAVKLLRAPAGPQRARLKREALSLAAVHHPAVVEVYDYGETPEGTPYLVMELVRGESMGERIQREGPLAAQAAVALMLPLLDGLAAAHRAGVVHRDIKPDNVVLAVGPAGVMPKLLDFGIARLDRGTDARLTAEGGFLGTPSYMAPEQVRGAVADERADVWGVGVLLYELIAGTSPFGVEDLIVVIRRVMDEPPSFPRGARGLDGKLWGILMAALRKEPGERTASAVAFRDGLAGWLAARGDGATARSGTMASVSMAQPAAGGPAVSGGPSVARVPAAPAGAQGERLAPTLVAEGPRGPRAPGAAGAPTTASAATLPARPTLEPVSGVEPEEAVSIDALIRAKFGQR